MHDSEHLTDTKPKRPSELQQPPPDASWTAPIDTTNLLSPEDNRPTREGRWLSLLVVMATSCLCVVLISLSALAGYRDELHEIQTDEARDLRATVVYQYDLALGNQENGLWILAYERLEWIATEMPDYLDVAGRMKTIEPILSYTPSPLPSATPSHTLTPTTIPIPTNTPTPTVLPVEAYFSQAQTYSDFGHYEDAIIWLDIVIAEDPTYRRAEVDSMLFEALTSQARLYFTAQNPVDESGANGLPGNQLARGITFTNRAQEIYNQRPSVGQPDDIPTFDAHVVELFLSAQSYINSGQPDLAIPVLERLCNLSCFWGYGGVSVQDLRAQVGLQ